MVRFRGGKGSLTSLVAQMAKNLSACNAGDWGSIAGGWEDPLEKREAGGTVDLAKTLGRVEKETFFFSPLLNHLALLSGPRNHIISK